MTELVFWKDREKGTVEPTLFSIEAEALAKSLTDDYEKSKGRKANKRTQIRKFYDELLSLDTEARLNPEKWDLILPRLHMMIAKAAYAKGRDLVSDKFLEFIKSAVVKTEKPQDLAVFANFFEAFMGFYRLYGPSN
jgi:CRISPR-associated protein Csm2